METSPILKYEDKVVTVDVFCDEVKEASIPTGDGSYEKWIYIGFLYIDIYKKVEAFNTLMSLRCRQGKNWSECKEQCEYHMKNGKEVHYRDLRDASVFHISERWVREFLNLKELKFYFFGINITKINPVFFGEVRGSEKFNRVYNRLFRSALSKSVKSFYHKYDKIIIRKIVHDTADIKNSDIFPWHSIYRLSEDDPKLSFSTNSIQFMDSNHNISYDRNSHFIQLTDLLTGLFFNSFHFASKYKKNQKLTEIIAPICEQLSKKKSRPLKLFGKIDLDFFPKQKITNEDSLENQQKRFQSFYKERKLFFYEDNGQLDLFTDL